MKRLSCDGCPHCESSPDGTVAPCARHASGPIADLSPPLGDPGGPCHVVERIVRRVRDPQLQKDLAEDVEKGVDLSNSEAAKVYKLDAEPGVGPIQQIKITAHGQYRMDLRGITVADVRQAIASFVKQLADWKALKNRAYDTYAKQLEGGENVEWVDPRSKLKVVFAKESEGIVRLITTFWRNQTNPPPTVCKIPRKAGMDTILALRVAARYQVSAIPQSVNSFLEVVKEQVPLARSYWTKLRGSQEVRGGPCGPPRDWGARRRELASSCRHCGEPFGADACASNTAGSNL